MTEEVVLLKRGAPVKYRVCDCCGKYARDLSRRGWCAACEFECTETGKRVRAKLEQMRDSGSASGKS